MACLWFYSIPVAVGWDFWPLGKIWSCGFGWTWGANHQSFTELYFSSHEKGLCSALCVSGTECVWMQSVQICSWQSSCSEIEHQHRTSRTTYVGMASAVLTSQTIGGFHTGDDVANFVCVKGQSKLVTSSNLHVSLQTNYWYWGKTYKGSFADCDKVLDATPMWKHFDAVASMWKPLLAV